MADYEFFIRSDIAEAGRTEDGEAIVIEKFYVVAEDRAGNRWAHGNAFPSAVVRYEEGQAYTVARPGAEMASRLRDRAEARGDINPAYWAPIAARYGSAAHDENDWCDDDDFARMRRGR